MTIWQIFNMIHWIILIKNYKNESFPLFYNNIIRYVGGITEFCYTLGLFGQIISFIIICIFNYSDSNHYKWFQIIKVFKGIQTMDSIGFYDEKAIRKLITKIKFIKFFTIILADFGTIFVCLTSLTILIIFFNSLNIIIGTLNALWLLISTFFVLKITTSFLYYFIVCDYCRMRFKLFNDILRNTRKISGSRKVNKLLCEHNRICGQIIGYNKFWKNFYFAINYTLIPMNLMLLQQLLFEDLMLITFIAILIISVGYSLTHFVLNHLAASINREASKSHKYLQKLFIKILSSIDPKRKLKVIFL
jgi:hypothetical protein